MASLKDMPEDLPGIIYYKMTFAILTALPRTPVQYISSSGCTNACIVRPTIPIGARRVWWHGCKSWQTIAEIPPAWLPYLQRERGTEMDPRPKVT